MLQAFVWLAVPLGHRRQARCLLSGVQHLLGPKNVVASDCWLCSEVTLLRCLSQNDHLPHEWSAALWHCGSTQQLSSCKGLTCQEFRCWKQSGRRASVACDGHPCLRRSRQAEGCRKRHRVLTTGGWISVPETRSGPIHALHERSWKLH